MSSLSFHQTHLLSKHFYSGSVATQLANAGNRKSPIPDSSPPKATKCVDLTSSPLALIAPPSGFRPHIVLLKDELAGEQVILPLPTPFSNLSLLASFSVSFLKYISTTVFLLLTASHLPVYRRVYEPLMILD